jgi:hypothetical protein
MSIEDLLILKRPALRPIARIGLGLTIAGLGVVAMRYAGVRRYNGAERLAEALLDSDPLHDAARSLPEASETVLAACATYLVSVAYRAAIGEGVAAEDPIGHSRTHEHPYTHATVTVLTESHAPEHLLTYAVNLPDIGEVRGTRRVGPIHTAGLTPARPAIDTTQITLPHGYTAQLESEFEIADYLVIGQIKLFGAATLRDNQGNVARLNIAYDGGVSGTITRDAHIIGRFEGKVATGVTFRQYEIGPGE